MAKHTTDSRRIPIAKRCPEFITCPCCQAEIRIWQWGDWGKALIDQPITSVHDVRVLATSDGHQNAYVRQCKGMAHAPT